MTSSAQPNQNSVSFYEGSYQFKHELTSLNIHQDYCQMILAKQYEYRPTNETLWCEVITGTVSKRYKFDYQSGLTEIVQKTEAAFQTWNAGGFQASSLYLGDAARNFEETHYNSGTFATLHVFATVEEGKEAHKQVMQEIFG